MPVQTGDRPKLDTASASNLKQLALGLTLYRSDHDARMPLASNWTDATGPYYRLPQLLRSPQDPKGPTVVALMRKLGEVSEATISEPTKQAVVFETTDRTRNAAHNFVNVWWHKDRRTAVAFWDGSVKVFWESDRGAPRAGTGLAP